MSYYSNFDREFLRYLMLKLKLKKTKKTSLNKSPTKSTECLGSSPIKTTPLNIRQPETTTFVIRNVWTDARADPAITSASEDVDISITNRVALLNVRREVTRRSTGRVCDAIETAQLVSDPENVSVSSVARKAKLRCSSTLSKEEFASLNAQQDCSFKTRRPASNVRHIATCAATTSACRAPKTLFFRPTKNASRAAPMVTSPTSRPAAASRVTRPARPASDRDRVNAGFVGIICSTTKGLV